MNQQTTQFVYKALVLAFIAVFIGTIGALIAAIFVFGDGEAQRIITDMTPVALGAFGSFALMFLGHQGVTAMQTAAQVGMQSAQNLQNAAQNAAQPIQTTAQTVPATLASVALTGAQGH